MRYEPFIPHPSSLDYQWVSLAFCRSSDFLRTVDFGCVGRTRSQTFGFTTCTELQHMACRLAGSLAGNMSRRAANSLEVPGQAGSKRTEPKRMDFQQFVHKIGCELQEILWKDVPRKPARGEIDRLEQDLGRASFALGRLRSSVQVVQNRLAQKQRRARWLEAQVELYLHVADRANAWRYALELDIFRRTLQQDRASLQRRRQAYQAQLARVRLLRQRLERPGQLLDGVRA